MTQYEILIYVSNSATLDALKDDADTALESILSGRKDSVPALSDTAREAIAESYISQVKPLYINAFVEKLFHEISKTQPLAVLDLKRMTEEMLADADQVLAAEMAPNPVERFRAEFPLIPEMEEKIRKNFIAAELEMLDQISAHRGEIARRFFGGKEILSIEALSGMEGDVHRKGRAVAGVATNAGKFYYKPHDCSLDQLYSELISRFFSDCTVAADCVPGEGCGFVSELVRAPLKSKAQARDYYRRFGMLTALFRCIGTTDMHHENLIPCGGFPAAVDLETLFRPIFSLASKTEEKTEGNHKIPLDLGEEFSVCVLTTAILPHYNPSLGCISPLYAGTGKADHLPYFGETAYSAEGYEEDFIEGFRRGYRRVLENRDAILELFMSCHNAPVRYILRNTSYYCLMQMQVNRGRFLVSREKQEENLRRLRIPYERAGVKVNEPVVEYEAKCLREGDIPYFCIAFDGKALCGSDTEEVIIPDFLSRSIRDRVTDLLNTLSEDNERFETDLLRSIMLHPPIDIPEEENPYPVAGRALRKDRVAPLIREISREIANSEIRASNGDILWYSQADNMFPPERGSLNLSCSSAALFTGLAAGAGLSAGPGQFKPFTAFLAKYVGSMEQAVPEIARKYWQPGIYDLAMVLFALDTLAAAGAKEAEGLFDKLVQQLCDKDIGLDTENEDLPDLAELVIAVCQSRTGHPGKAEWIGKSAERLAGFRPEGKGVSGTADSDTAISEGSGEQKDHSKAQKAAEKLTEVRIAAVAAALAMAGEAAGRKDFLEAAGSLLSYVRSVYREDLRGWPDEKAKFRWAAPRGPQAPWIGLCALAAAKANVPGAEELVRLSLESVMDEPALRYNDSLCHGNAMSVLFLTEASRHGREDKYARQAGRILAAMVRRKKEKGAFYTFPKKVRSAFDVSFIHGSTGIGAAALNWLRFVQGN